MAKDKTQILVIYPGRFQPFTKGHKAVYEYLTDKYDNVYVATSDKVDPPRSPFSFEEKKMMMELTGMDTTNVVLTKSPYVAMEITQNFDRENTILLFAVSKKDMAEDPRFTFKPKKDGSPSYFQAEPKDGQMETMDKHGYIITVPTFKFNVLGKPMTSATEVRSSFANMDDDTKKKLIIDLFGNYSDAVFDLMSSKITESEQHGSDKRRIFSGLDHEIREATKTLEDLFMKVKDSPVGTKVRQRFMISFYGALNALKQQMSINLAIRENYGLDKVSLPDVITLKRKADSVNLVLSESNNKVQIKVLETGKILPLRDLNKIYKRGYRKLQENKKMTSLNDKKIINYYNSLLAKSKKDWNDPGVRLSPLQDTISKFSHSGNDTTQIKKLISGLKEEKNMLSQKLGVFAKGKNKVSIWETNGTIVLLDQRSQRLQETKGSVSEAVNALYDRGYICESVDMTTLKNAAGAIMNVFFDTIKNTTTVRDQEGGSRTYQAASDKVIAALQKKGFKASRGNTSGLSLEPMAGQQEPGQMGMHGKMLNAGKMSEDSQGEDLNKGYDDGFHGDKPAHPKNSEYMSGYKIGSTDGEDRKAHLGEETENKLLASADECDTCADLGYIPTTGEVCPDCNDGEELMAAYQRPQAQKRIRAHKLKF